MVARIASFILKSYGIIAFAACLLLSAFYEQLRSHPSANKQWDLKQSWIVSPAQAKHMQENGALLIDARAVHLRFLNSLKGSKNISWEELSLPHEPLKGKLLPATELQKKWNELKFKPSDTFLVFGDPLSGWGEEGRLVWTLRMSGFPKSYWVDGGVKNFLFQKNIGSPVEESPSNKIESNKKEFIPTRQGNFDIDILSLQKSLSQNQTLYTIIDVREEREYLGETPYGESRGGHIPGAKWIFYKDFLDKDGFIKPKEEVLKILKLKNTSTDSTLVSYCTGGIRSAWTTSVFQSYGVRSLNYSGSMWEWSAGDEKVYPLLKGNE
jgi:thiosulfate/3-mercaptopyruvate sulfurtransferase